MKDELLALLAPEQRLPEPRPKPKLKRKKPHPEKPLLSVEERTSKAREAHMQQARERFLKAIPFPPGSTTVMAIQAKTRLHHDYIRRYVRKLQQEGYVAFFWSKENGKATKRWYQISKLEEA